MKCSLIGILFSATFVCCLIAATAADDDKGENEQVKYRIEGKVLITGQQHGVITRLGNNINNSSAAAAAAAWTQQVYVTVDNGKHRAFLKNDGWFTVNNVAPGSYIVEVSHPNYEFDAVRVYISSSGKIQAHKLNYVQPSKSPRVTYPLRFKSKGRANYFESRTSKQQIIDQTTILTYMPLIVAPILLFMMLQGAGPAAAEELRALENPLAEAQADALSKLRDWTDLTEIVMWLFGSRTDKRTNTGSHGKLGRTRSTNNNHRTQSAEHTLTPAAGSAVGQPHAKRHRRHGKHK